MTAEVGVIVDSSMNFAGSIAGTAAPDGFIATLCLIQVRHHGFNDHPHEGQLVVHQELAEDLGEVFTMSQAPLSRRSLNR